MAQEPAAATFMKHMLPSACAFQAPSCENKFPGNCLLCQSTTKCSINARAKGSNLRKARPSCSVRASQRGSSTALVARRPVGPLLKWPCDPCLAAFKPIAAAAAPPAPSRFLRRWSRRSAPIQRGAAAGITGGSRGAGDRAPSGAAPRQRGPPGAGKTSLEGRPRPPSGHRALAPPAVSGRGASPKPAQGHGERRFAGQIVTAAWPGSQAACRPGTRKAEPF